MLDRAAPLALLVTALALVSACDRGQAEGGSSDSKAAAKDAPAAPDASAKDDDGSQVAGTQKEAASGDKGDETEPSAPATAGKDGKTRAAEVKAAAKAAGDEAKTKRTKLLTLLNDGREAVKDKRYEEGIGLYRQALAIDPADPKVLGELGFAALKMDDLELAESSTRRAIDLTPADSRSLGALYYNLGLIEEKRGRAAAARTAYERSLAARPDNEIVAGKLAKLGEGVTQTGPASAQALCKEIMSEWECYGSETEILALPDEDQEFAGLCECKRDKLIAAGPDNPFIVEAALLSLDGTPGYGGMLDNAYLAVRTAGEGWQLVGQLVSGYSPGVMGISNTGEIEAFEFVDLAAAPGLELRVVYSNSGLDSNMGINTLDFDDSATTTVCYVTGDQAGSCAHFQTLSASGTDRLFDDEPCDEELSETRWELKLDIGDDKVSVEAVAGKDALPKALDGFVGEHSFADAAKHPGVSTTPLH